MRTCLGVEKEPPAGVGWVPALRLGAWRGRSRICVHCIKLEGIEDDLSLNWWGRLAQGIE